MQKDEAVDHEADLFPMGMLLILTFQGVVWFGIGLLLGRAIWGPAF